MLKLAITNGIIFSFHFLSFSYFFPRWGWPIVMKFSLLPIPFRIIFLKNTKSALNFVLDNSIDFWRRGRLLQTPAPKCNGWGNGSRMRRKFERFQNCTIAQFQFLQFHNCILAWLLLYLFYVWLIYLHIIAISIEAFETQINFKLYL